MRQIFFVTEGVTDQIVLEGLVSSWLGDEDFISNRLQPPSSAYADALDTRLSEGWRGVVSWCSAVTPALQVSRDSVINRADLIVVHVDADVGFDANFSAPAYAAPTPPASKLCDHVRSVMVNFFGAALPAKMVLCVPAQDLESWLVAALHPDVADANSPIDCFHAPGNLLAGKDPHRLLRYKDGKLRKITSRYKDALPAALSNWHECEARVKGALSRPVWLTST